MNEAMQKMIEELASKLGTTAEHLWEVLCKQAPINSLCLMLASVAGFVGLLWAFRFVTRKTKEPEDSHAEWEDDGAALAWIIWGITAIGLMVLFVGSIPTIVTGFINPEYWALKQVSP